MDCDQSDSHRCPVHGCTAQVPYHQLMCPRHWRMVASSLKRRVYDAWGYGRGAGTPYHVEACDAAIRDVELKLAAIR